ncbi:MAG TPA: methyltransferase domain-containing protein [Thermoprotei archaeon]|nr:methyltransferase domain-containing protein [Thermoprotei archaeon]
MRDYEDVLEWYESIAPSYDELYSAEQRGKYREAFRYLEDVDGKVVYDLGCGTSEFLLYLSKKSRIKAYVGLDISLNLLEMAANKAKDSATPSFFVAGDISSPPFREGSGDIATAFTVLRCRDDLELVTSRMRTLLRSGGRLVVTVLCEEGADSVPTGWCRGSFKTLNRREGICVEVVHE